MQTIDAFARSVSAESPPEVGLALQALWWVRRGDWSRAHECVQQREGEADCDSVHAHLHRQEGDLNNAGYWYRRAGRPMPQLTLDEEWTALATELLSRA